MVDAEPATWGRFGVGLATNGRRLAVYLLGFAALGYLVIRILPTGLLTTWLGAGNPVWSVPLAALLGVPVYLTTDASLPLVATLLDGGMAPGAGIAFLITGAGTSVGAISGMLVIARRFVRGMHSSSLMTVRGEQGDEVRMVAEFFVQHLCDKLIASLGEVSVFFSVHGDDFFV